MCLTTFYLLLEQFNMALLFSFKFLSLRNGNKIQFAKRVDTYSFPLVNVITWQSLGQIWCYIQLMTL